MKTPTRWRRVEAFSGDFDHQIISKPGVAGFSGIETIGELSEMLPGLSRRSPKGDIEGGAQACGAGARSRVPRMALDLGKVVEAIRQYCAVPKRFTTSMSQLPK